jgi:CubicO group peptidase (beta-lactamase class C family)
MGMGAWTSMRIICSILGAMAFLAACSARGAVPAAAPGGSNGTSIVRQAGSPIAIAGTGTDPALDRIVTSFMAYNDVPNAELAVSSHGKTIFSHAYTYDTLAASTTATTTIMRIASCTKPLTSAAIFNLARQQKLDVNAKIFAYLSITQPFKPGTHVDPRIYDISIKNMLDHKSGWNWSAAASGDDPAFKLREIAQYFGLRHAVDQTQYVQYQLKYPLQAQPGTLESYCNYCYDMLGMVVAKASNMSYIQYLQSAVVTPSGGGEVAISPTLNPRLPGEVARYYNTFKGLSSIYIESNDQYPFPYSGDNGILEISQGDGGVATSAETLLAFMNHYSIGRYGLPPAKPELGKDYYAGEIPGTLSCAEQLPDGKNYAFIVNKDQFPYEPGAFGQAQREIQLSLYPPASTYKGRSC